MPFENETFEVKGATIFSTKDRQLAYWKAGVIRNFTKDTLSYKTDPNGQADIIPAQAERDVEGWGSYLEIVATGNPINAIVVLSLVDLATAAGRGTQ